MSETMLGKAGRSPYLMLQSVLNRLISSTGGTLLRFILFWFGPSLYSWTPRYIALLTILAFLGLKDVAPVFTIPQRVVILVPLITFPLIYYLVPYMPRYRIPIDWMILLLAGAEIMHLVKPKNQDSCEMEKNEVFGQGVTTNGVL